MEGKLYFVYTNAKLYYQTVVVPRIRVQYIPC